MSVFQELYVWFVFGIILTLAWAIGLNAAKSRYSNYMGSTCRRPYLVALCAYALAVTWFYIAFMVVVLLVWCTFLDMTKDKIDLSIWKWLVENLAQPSVVLRSFDEQHTWLHIVVATFALAASGWIVGFYITDEDLMAASGSGASSDSSTTVYVYRKLLRALGVIPAIMGVVYFVFAIAQIIKSSD